MPCSSYPGRSASFSATRWWAREDSVTTRLARTWRSCPGCIAGLPIRNGAAELLFVAAVLYGTLISLSAVVLEELTFRRYPRARDLLVLAGFAVLENFGYRQLTTWWRVRGTMDFLRNKQGWGTMTRKGFAKA